jgi:hypothetical protein
MASHGCPLLDTLHMVEHHPRIFEITTGLHPLTKSTPLPGPTLDLLNTKTLSELEPWPGNKFSWTYGQLLQPLSMVMPSMTPYLCMYLNEVTSFLMLGELIYLHLSRTGTNSSKVKVFAGTPSGLSNSSPRSSLVARLSCGRFRTDDQTMAAGASVAWTHCSVLF